MSVCCPKAVSETPVTNPTVQWMRGLFGKFKSQSTKFLSSPSESFEKEAELKSVRLANHRFMQNSRAVDFANDRLSVPFQQNLNQQLQGDFSKVKLHNDAESYRFNQQLKSQAFVFGNDIFFGKGKFSPESAAGKKLLAHELTHIAQQQTNAVLDNQIQRKVEDDTSVTPLADARSIPPPVCSDTTLKEIEKFKSQWIYGPKDITPKDTGTGSFTASYIPLAEMLYIMVTGKTAFVNGIDVTGFQAKAGESNLQGLADLMNLVGDPLVNAQIAVYYTWSEAQKGEAMALYKQRLSEAAHLWQDTGMSFVVDIPCWSNVKARPKINLNVQEVGNAQLIGAQAGNRDNLQVKLVKNPSADEEAAVQFWVKLLTKKLELLESERRQTMNRAKLGTSTGARVTTWRYQTGEDKKYSAVMTRSSNDLLNHPGKQENKRSLLRRSVYFEHDKFNLDGHDKAELLRFIQDSQEADNQSENSKVTLAGHASAPGSSHYNTQLVEKRLSSVFNFLKDKGFLNIETRVVSTNRSDSEAEKEKESNESDKDFRRVDMIVGSGELQNTVAHEFGHVFGLKDEYVSVGTSFSGSGTAAGTTVAHSGMSEKIGGNKAVSESSDNMMSMGNRVQKQHYATFGWALKELTGKDWKLA